MYKKFHDDLCHFEVNYGYDVVLFIDTETSELDTEVIEFHDLSIHEKNFLINDWAICPEVSLYCGTQDTGMDSLARHVEAVIILKFCVPM